MIQITKCKCGSVICACTEPECYTNAGYQRDTRNYIKKGCTVEMVEPKMFEFAECTCKTPKKDKNQIDIFANN